jgi:hypothetical protein
MQVLLNEEKKKKEFITLNTGGRNRPNFSHTSLIVELCVSSKDKLKNYVRMSDEGLNAGMSNLQPRSLLYYTECAIHSILSIYLHLITVIIT